MKQWYEELFENYAGQYDKESYTQGTLAEVDFIESELGNDRSRRILDIGCGTGRHAIELARRGYPVTGLDLSEGQIAAARKKAAALNVTVDFLVRDARAIGFSAAFDAAIMLCEGAFPLMETDEMNFQILENARQALRPGGRFIFTTLNALFPLRHSVKEFLNSEGSQVISAENHFDLMTFRDHSSVVFADDSGSERKLQCNERYYAPSEIAWLLKSLGFKNIGIFGCQTGRFSRARTLTSDDFEMLVVADK